ncbi:MAG: hypothetical protein ABIG28_01390 [archaeon]
MAVDVKKLIAAINPDLYCSPEVVKDVKKLAKGGDYLKAAEKAKLRDSDYIDVIFKMFTDNAFGCAGLKHPIEQHKLVYDAFAQNLEPIYFWVLDYVNSFFDGSDKLVDNFVSSAGSGHFSEMQSRASRMQEEAMKMMQTAGILLKSVLQIIYDLKEFKLVLAPYDELKSKDAKQREASYLSLKQRWMDKVDINRGAGSINAMAQQLDFVTLRDAFMAAESLVGVDKLDLNERVKRILKMRFSEFERWIGASEKELKKRYEIEKIHLKSQINSLRLYSRWAKPYFKAARQLEQNLAASADLVTMFNTSIFELVLLAKGKYDPKKDVAQGNLPKVYEKLKLRKYTPLTIIEFNFRSVPDREQQGGHNFRGKAEVSFTSFALNEDEMKILKEQIEKDDFGDVYKMIEGATDESLGQLKDDLDEFLGEKDKQKEEKKEEDTNPFSALFSFFEKDDSKKKDEKGEIKSDSNYEKVVRSQAVLGARWACRKLYDDYKKAHEMPSFPPVIN